MKIIRRFEGAHGIESINMCDMKTRYTGKNIDLKKIFLERGNDLISIYQNHGGYESHSSLEDDFIKEIENSTSAKASCCKGYVSIVVNK